MYFPTAGIECHPLIPPLAAFCVSVFTSMGGISGAFLLLPFQMSFLGYVNPSVSATNQFFNVVATPAGVWRFTREQRMLWPLGLAVIVGTLPGVFIGALIRVTCLPDPRLFKIFAGCVLLYIAIRMLRDLLKAQGSRKAGVKNGSTPFHVELQEWNLQKVRYTFNGEEYSFSTRGVLLLTFIVGIVGGIYGIGGGAIIAPFLVSFFGLPVHTIAGAALLGTFMTSLTAVIFYMAIAPFFPDVAIAPDFLLGFLLGIGGMAGIYCGARLQKYVPARAIKYLLTAVLLFTAFRYLKNIF